MKVIAIDDEPIALSIIARYCERRGGITLETYSAPRVGMQRVRECQPDIVLLDIEMNGTSGIELAKQLPPSCCLIFTTAYAHYALDGFEVNAVDFLHKPFSYQRFVTAVRKMRELSRLRSMAMAGDRDGGEITVKSEYRNVNVPLSRIRYIEAMDNYSKILLSDGSQVLTQMSLKEMSEMLPSGKFIRIHRSFIIPSDKVSGYSGRAVSLSCGVTLPVGRVYSSDFLSCMKVREVSVRL